VKKTILHGLYRSGILRGASSEATILPLRTAWGGVPRPDVERRLISTVTVERENRWFATADIARLSVAPKMARRRCRFTASDTFSSALFAKGFGKSVELSARVELTPEGESISLQAGSFQSVWNWGSQWLLQRASLIVSGVRIVHCANQRNAIRETVLANQNGMPLSR